MSTEKPSPLNNSICRQVWGTFILLIVGVKGPRPLWEVPPLGRWSWVKKANWASQESEPVRNISPWLWLHFPFPCLEFLPWFPFMMDHDQDL